MVSDPSFMEGSFTDRIYEFILSKRAVIGNEVLLEFERDGLTRTSVNSYLRILLAKGLVIKSERKVQSPARRCSSAFVYGLTPEDIESKIYDLEKPIDLVDFLEGIQKRIYEIVLGSPVGFLPNEVMFELRKLEGFKDYDNWDYVYNVLRFLYERDLITKSLFDVPRGKFKAFVYGRDNEAVLSKLLKVMPESVLAAYNTIRKSDSVFSSDELRSRCKVSNRDMLTWVNARLVKNCWIKRSNYKHRNYYFNLGLEESCIQGVIERKHEKEIKKLIVENANLGRLKEEQLLFYFVMYQKLHNNCNIRLNKDFPHKIPDWFSRKDIENPEFKDQESGKLLVDVWRFDSEPIDFLVFTYDETLGVMDKGFSVSVKKDRNGRYLGKAGRSYLTSFIGCQLTGRSLNMHRIPNSMMLTPTLFVTAVDGNSIFKWAFERGCLVFWKAKLDKMQEYVNNQGFEYKNDLKIVQYEERLKLYELYQNHKDVILGNINIEDLLKARGVLNAA